MRRTTTTILVALACALLLAGAALASYRNGGVTPHTSSSPNAAGIEQSYLLIGGLTLFIFVLVEGLLLYFVFRFRRRRARAAEGPQIHGSTRLEFLWTVFPVVVLATIAGFVFYKLPGIQDVPAATAAGGRIDIRVEGRQFYWLFRYPNGAVSYDRLLVPAGRNVKLDVTAPAGDVIHSWWIPSLGGKIDAIPGRVNHTWFRAPQGNYTGQCAEFCGVQHAVMEAEVVAVPEGAYRGFVAGQKRLLDSGGAELGRQEFDQVCAKCHRLSGERLIGPNLAGNPLLADRNALAQVVRNGRLTMPAVGQGWSDGQIDALVAYTKRIAKGSVGGG